MIRRLSQGLAAIGALGCGGKQNAATTPTPPVASPLSGLVGQAMLVTPTQRARVAADLNWTGVPRPPELITALDSGIITTLHARDAFRNWVFGDGLLLSFTRNPSYATDPRALSIEPLVGRGGTIPGTRLTEPLASQLRTMIALHDGRLVMIPVELRIESMGAGSAGMGRAVLRTGAGRSAVVRCEMDVGDQGRPRVGVRSGNHRQLCHQSCQSVHRPLRASNATISKRAHGNSCHTDSGRRHWAVHHQSHGSFAGGGRRRDRLGPAGGGNGRDRQIR